MADHKANAIAHLEVAEEHRQRIDWDAYDEADLGKAELDLKAAHVHATLAVAGEQRTANLIAYLGLALSDASDITDKGGLQQVADDIVKGLGGANWIGRFRK